VTETKFIVTIALIYCWYRNTICL